MEDVEDEARDEHLATRGGPGSRAKSSQHATSSNMPKPRVSHFGGIPGSVSPESAQKHAQAWVSHFVGGRSCPKKRPRTSLGFTCSQNSWSRRKRTKTYPSLGCTFSRGFLGRSRQKNPEAHGNGPRSTVSISPRSRPHNWPSQSPQRLRCLPDAREHFQLTGRSGLCVSEAMASTPRTLPSAKANGKVASSCAMPLQRVPWRL